MGQAILVAGIGVGDVGLGFLEFGLAEFDDGAETLSSWHSHSRLSSNAQKRIISHLETLMSLQPIMPTPVAFLMTNE